MSHPKLSKTNIEYGDRSWNFFPGCLHKPKGICPVPNCWAEGMTKRQLRDFHKPHLIPELVPAPLHVKKPSVILVNFMGDIMGDWVNPNMPVGGFEGNQLVAYSITNRDGKKLWELSKIVLRIIESCPQHQFLFLTKAPWNYKRWRPWPENAWLGATAWDEQGLIKALYDLTEANRSIEAKLWLSVEPMYGPVVPKVWPAEWDMIRWVVVGAQSNPVRNPEVEWVEDLVVECIKAGKPVFLKKNLVKALPQAMPFYVPPKDLPDKGRFATIYRQEMPEELCLRC